MAQNWATINRRRRPFVVKYSRAWYWEYLTVGREFNAMIMKYGADAVGWIDTLKFPGMDALWVEMYVDCGTAFARDARRSYTKSYIPNIETKADQRRKPGQTVNNDPDELLYDSWVARMKRYAEEEAGLLIETIKRTAKEEIHRVVGGILDKGFEEGLSRDKMASAISEAFMDEWGDASKWMGRRVAQTEMIRASNYGTLEGVESLGVPYDRVWYTGGANIRPTHQEAHGQLVDENEPFKVGGYDCWYPGDPSLPPEESINCKCAVSARPKGGY